METRDSILLRIHLNYRSSVSTETGYTPFTQRIPCYKPGCFTLIKATNGVLVLSSRRQDSVALYVWDWEHGRERGWQRNSLPSRYSSRLGHAKTAPTNIYEDNLACIVISTNPVRRKSSPHLHPRPFLPRAFYFWCYAPDSSADPPHGCRCTKSLPGPVLTQHREDILGHTPFYARLLH